MSRSPSPLPHAGSGDFTYIDLYRYLLYKDSVNLNVAACTAALCTSAILTTACGTSTEAPVSTPSEATASSSTTEVTTITPTRAYSKEELALQNPRLPEERFGTHYTDQGTVGTKCIVVVAKTIVDEQPNYEAVVYTNPPYFDELVFRGYSVPAEFINRLSEAPAIQEKCS